jgi:hypothetical protein
MADWMEVGERKSMGGGEEDSARGEREVSVVAMVVG